MRMMNYICGAVFALEGYIRDEVETLQLYWGVFLWKKDKFNGTISCVKRGVLLTRGSKGLIIYAVDEKLRNALYSALKGEN